MKEKSKRTKFLSEYSYIAVYVIILIVYVITNHGLTMSGFMNIFRHSAVIGIIGFGMGLICLTGDIDLSVGSMLALVSGFSVVIFNMTDNILLTFLFAVGFGAVCGLINGYAGRIWKNSGIYCNTCDNAYLPLICTVLLPAYR